MHRGCIGGIQLSLIFARGKERKRAAARSMLCFWVVRGLGISLAELSSRLDISPSGISLSVRRGERMAKENDHALSKELKPQN
jgi:putative transposase